MQLLMSSLLMVKGHRLTQHLQVIPLRGQTCDYSQFNFVQPSSLMRFIEIYWSWLVDLRNFFKVNINYSSNYLYKIPLALKETNQQTRKLFIHLSIYLHPSKQQLNIDSLHSLTNQPTKTTTVHPQKTYNGKFKTLMLMHRMEYLYSNRKLPRNRVPGGWMVTWMG